MSLRSACLLSPLLLAMASATAGSLVPQRIDHLSRRAITLVYAGHSIDGKPAPADSYTIHCPADGNGPDLPTSGVGYDRQVVGFDSQGQPQVETRIHLLFPYPLPMDMDCRLSAAGDTTENLTIRFDADAVSPSIQVDQVGYLPWARKYAYVGNWLGTLGPMPVDAGRFSVIDTDTGKTVLQGPVLLRQKADPWSGNDVYEADFSELNREGNYRIQVAGTGVSHPFRIAADVYEPVYRSTARLFYHSRNSTPIVEPWADPGHERPKGGIPPALNGFIHPAVTHSVFANGERAGERHPVSRGWFDAGDYGQYIPNAAPVWYAISVGFDLAPERMADDGLNIPESGNGIPDLLDELDWGMDWALDMQDPKDGGVYFRLSPEHWDEGLPHTVKTPRYLYEKTSHATASFAAMAAIHARLMAPYDARRARQSLSAAKAAWRFLETRPQWPEEGKRYKNPPGTHAGEYRDESALDNRLWAAAELWRTTGDDTYARAYAELFPRVKIDATAGVTYRHQAMAALWAYLMADGQRDPVLEKAARRQLLSAAKWYIREGESHPYRAPMHHHRPFLGWGSFAISVRAALPLLQAWYLTGEERYLDWLWLTPHPQLGANPQNRCYITGMGANSPRHPLSKLSQYDQAEEPLRGIPVPGPHYHLPALWPETKLVNDGYLPPAGDGDDSHQVYPPLRRYTDASLLPPMSEPTVADYALVAVAYALLGNRFTTQKKQP
jgi:hypothetical protein